MLSPQDKSGDTFVADSDRTGGWLLLHTIAGINHNPAAVLTDSMELTMNYHDRDTYGMYKNPGFIPGITERGPGPQLMGAETLIGNDVYNLAGEDLGDIKEIMLDVPSGRIAYAVLSFSTFLGMGEKLFAVPWSALTLDTIEKRFVLNVDLERLKDAPGFDKGNWPDMADSNWGKRIHAYYGVETDHHG